MMEFAKKLWYSARRLWWKAYWNIQVRGTEHLPQSGGYLLCANHASHLDAAAILAALPRETALRVRTAAAKDVFEDRPFYNFFARLTTDSLAIERNAAFARGLRALEEVLRSGRPMILFPEGRRSPDGRMLEFQPGAAMLSVRTGSPIVPVHLRGVDAALPRGSMLLDPAPVRVTFGPPIDPALHARGSDRRSAYERITSLLRSGIESLAAR
jgi:1-acyl-sn-glycerol-3-phosphate acyltransferase